MHGAQLSQLAVEALYLALMVSAPVLVASLVAGVLIGLLQAVTQVHDYTVGFVPKLIAVALVLVLGGGWMGGQVVRYASGLWRSIPQLVN